MPEIAKPFELRERSDDKLPYDPKAIRGGIPAAAPAELTQQPEAPPPPPDPQPQPNAPAAIQEIQQETTLSDDTTEQQSLTFKG
jgi:hypothetical protein